jgi:uncharacterized repeat protein (TIGR03837 family)
MQTPSDSHALSTSSDIPPSTGPAPRCALFCRVIDNYGDAGVCWRLARQLAREYGWHVRLFIDVPTVLQGFLSVSAQAEWTRTAPAPLPGPQEIADKVPAMPIGQATTPPLATIDGVDILPWPGLTADGIARTDGLVWPIGDDPGDIVIEAFACDLPEPVLLAMAARHAAPIWLNLEYLSAEEWVNDCHLMPSRHPRLGLEKTFFFPGVRPGTGGVLREHDLREQRLRFLGDPTAQAALWHSLGVSPPAADHLVVTLFAYENPALEGLLGAWSDSGWLTARHDDAPWRGLTVLVPQGRISPQVARFFGRQTLAVGETLQRGALTVHAIPFVSQDDYDRLLWCADLNFVRGEDSFVRAQWAERPFVWHIYPQDEAAHLPKLTAALTCYLEGAGLPDPVAAPLRALWHRWNGADGTDGADEKVGDGKQTPPAHATDPASTAPSLSDRSWETLWHNVARQLPRYRDGSALWAACLRTPGDLAGNLVRFRATKSDSP